MQNIVECPYNPKHLIKKESLLKHIKKCKEGKKNPGKIKHCKGNYIIIYYKKDEETHKKQCEFCGNAKYEGSLIDESQMISHIVDKTALDLGIKAFTLAEDNKTMNNSLSNSLSQESESVLSTDTVKTNTILY